jgi:hypothetical protein
MCSISISLIVGLVLAIEPGASLYEGVHDNELRTGMTLTWAMLESPNVAFSRRNLVLKESTSSTSLEFMLGVFAGEAIQKGEIVEISPVILCTFEDIRKKDAEGRMSQLAHRVFPGLSEGGCAIPLGFGSVYISSPTNANIRWLHLTDRIMIFEATTDIQQGDELLISR